MFYRTFTGSEIKEIDGFKHGYTGLCRILDRLSLPKNDILSFI